MRDEEIRERIENIREDHRTEHPTNRDQCQCDTNFLLDALAAARAERDGWMAQAEREGALVRKLSEDVTALTAACLAAEEKIRMLEGKPA